MYGTLLIELLSFVTAAAGLQVIKPELAQLTTVEV
jgi:hypothetical protein